MFPFKKKQQQSTFPVPGKITLSSDLPLQLRRAQSVDDSLAAAIHRVCSETPVIAACYLLDARKPETEEIGMMIALTVDDEARQMDEVSKKFQAMLRQFPEQAHRILITSSAGFLPAFEGAKFYFR